MAAALRCARVFGAATGLLVVLWLGLGARPAQAAGNYLQVFIRTPYLELHTGPGRGYPVFNVVDRDASVDVLKRYTDWFKVRTTTGVEGWASAHDMEQTVLADGTHFHYDVGDSDAYTSHRFEAGAFFYGDYGGASAMSLYGAVFANPTCQRNYRWGNSWAGPRTAIPSIWDCPTSSTRRPGWPRS